ncbi:lysophospholipid acyltransferase family protein [Alloscardovia venturai]|uniref:Lysophospholipid acyltransferase family protein n=1 Tax=Alloscardovia venturai TaxID=1769421 RepID=A0ABW2Y4P7_9BIFI
MIIGGDMRPVVANMERNFKNGNLNAKSFEGDPVVEKKKMLHIVREHLAYRNTAGYAFKNFWARALVRTASRYVINRTTQYVGLEKLDGIKDTGAFITSNHFNQLENTGIFAAMRKAHKNTYVISQDTNLEMKGWIGFILKYYDTIPITKDHEYLSVDLPRVMDKILNKDKDCILIYPEAELWFNYRRPRPFKHGAYDFAVQHHVPVVSCFTEIIDTGVPEKHHDQFNQVKYVVHILDVIYPDESLPPHDASEKMRETDYALKVKAFENIYHRSIDEPFDAHKDIAGWRL